ncbi:MAG: POTRA domain-containing protein [Planctomycetota bacterium]
MDRTLFESKIDAGCRTPRAWNSTPLALAAGHSPSIIHPAWLLLLVPFFTGCLTSNSMLSELPIPPSVVDTTQLDNVRYQSPDTMTGSSNHVTSRNRLPFVEDQQAIREQPGSEQAGQRIAAVKVIGNTTIPEHRVLRSISTRPGRFFDPDKLQQDVNQLWRMPEIKRVKGPYLEQTDAGIVVTLEVEERQAITKVEFIGNRGIADRTLKKETGLEDGRPLDVHQIRMAKTRLEELYKEKGYPRTQVEIMEGADQEDSKVVFLIHEDEKQRIWNVIFEGNTIASDARLRHFIQSKPGILKVFGGLVNRDEIEQDITRLTSYYRSLGFFNARIGREVSESNDGRWLTIRFIINEGPRYKVRNVSFLGAEAFQPEQLETLVELKPGEEGSPEFNSAKMNKDVVALRDLYGSQGYVFATVEAEPRFLEEPGLLDIVYKVNEGKQYVVGSINVHYVGGGGITKREVIFNRLSLQPGDLVNNREIRNSERRLGSSQVFAVGGQTGGPPPRIVVRPPELKDLERFAQESGIGGSRF